jgi:carotenoid phi-ring synthase / carotenoid chi-ring synthase
VSTRVPVSRLVGRLMGMRPYLASAPTGPPGVAPPGAGPRVVVVGGGIAGASAAVILAERGFPVVICEAGDRLGGRLGAHPRTLPDGTVQWVDHGFHGFFRQYYNWRRILDRISAGPAPLLHPLGSYPVTSQRWPEEEFDRLPPTPPLSILALTLRSPSLRLRDLARADHTVGLSLLGFDAGQTYAHLDQVSAEQLLAALRLPERARVMLFNVFAHSFFNDAASMSAAELVAMFHFYFLANPEGLGMDAPHADYQSAIWTPLGRYLRQRGVQLQTGTPVTAIDRDPAGSWRVRTGSGATLTADEVVLATDAGTAARILGASPGVTSGDQRLAAVAAQPRTGPPYAVARYWLDGDVRAERAQFTSIADPGVLDSVTLYHRFEAGARSWHERTGGSVVELHAYACPPGAAAELGAAMLAELGQLWPETRRLHRVDEHCHVGTDAAGFPVGGHAATPGPRTAVPGLTLAGDWVATPFPSALMERAAATGIGAANVILAAHGYRTEPVWSVPPRGILAGRWAASMRHPSPRWAALQGPGQQGPAQQGPGQQGAGQQGPGQREPARPVRTP